MVQTLWDSITEFLSPEAGQARTRALNESIGYYIPPEMRGLLGFVADATPSAAYGRAAQASQEMVAPDRSIMDRIGSAGRMLSSTAEIAAPMAVAGRAGMPAAQAVQEGLLGLSIAADDAARRFVADQSGSIGAGLPAPRNEAEAMARNILEMRAAGRAGDVTEEMRAAADPMYMYQNTPLPMDEASRMARAREIGRVDDQYHATLSDFQAFQPSETGLVGRGVYSGDFATDIEDYARKQGTSEGLNIIPLLAPSEQTYARRIDWQNLVDADEAFPWNATVDETIQGFKRAADTMSSQGYSGVNSQPGERATFDPASLRSRFALFDPEFRHLRNLSAGIGGLGLLSLPQDEEMQ